MNIGDEVLYTDYVKIVDIKDGYAYIENEGTKGYVKLSTLSELEEEPLPIIGADGSV